MATFLLKWLLDRNDDLKYRLDIVPVWLFAKRFGRFLIW